MSKSERRRECRPCLKAALAFALTFTIAGLAEGGPGGQAFPGMAPPGIPPIRSYPVFVLNLSPGDLRFAIRYKGRDRKWHTSDWTDVKQKETSSQLESTSDEIYYYAETNDGKLKWEGKLSEDGKGHFFEIGENRDIRLFRSRPAPKGKVGAAVIILQIP